MPYRAEIYRKEGVVGVPLVRHADDVKLVNGDSYGSVESIGFRENASGDSVLFINPLNVVAVYVERQ